MDATKPKHDDMVPFARPADFLSGLDVATTAEIVTSATDVALIIDDGIIRDVSVGNADLVAEGYASAWRGKPWVNTVAADSRKKIEDLLKGAGGGRSWWRQVNHPSASALDVPVKYIAINIGPKDRLLALGQDLRSVAALQQRLIEAQQGLERDYSRLRQTEARYRLLFEAISEPVVIVNAATLKIDEANRAVGDLLGALPASLCGRALAGLVCETTRRGVDMVIARALATGQALGEEVELVSGQRCRIAASAFREDRATRLIVRFLPEGSDPVEVSARRALHDVLEALPDGLVVVDMDLRILAANRAFVDMTKSASDSQVVGIRLVDVLGRSATDINVLVSTLKTHGLVRNFGTVLRDRFGVEDSVEVSAVGAPVGGSEVIGLSVRNVSRRLQTGARIGEQLPRSVDQLTELVGRVPLKDIVRESTDLIEKLCIEAALEITDHNRASAAEMLGLSRQGLYSKLKRSGIDNNRS